MATGGRSITKATATAVALAAVLLAAPVAALAEETDDLKVWVSILPQAWVVDRIGGDAVSSHVLVGPGQSPATYEPTPHQMAEIEEADLYIRVGVPFEKTLLRRILPSMPDLPVIDGTAGIELLTIGGEHDGHGHRAGEPDPHFWLDPVLFKVHADSVRAALCEASPTQCPLFASRTAALQDELDDVNIRVTKRLSSSIGREIIAYHSAYAYFARRYGLVVVAAEAGGKEPGPRLLAELIDRARESGARAVFVQPQFSTRTAAALAEAIGAELIPLDPLARSYLENLILMAERIAGALEGA